MEKKVSILIILLIILQKKCLLFILKTCRNYSLRCSDHFKENFRLICVCIPELHRFSYFRFGGRRPYWISCSHAFSTAEIFWGFVFLDSGGSKATFLKNSAFYIFFWGFQDCSWGIGFKYVSSVFSQTGVQ